MEKSDYVSSAQEALELAQKKALGYDDLIKRITTCAVMGQVSCFISELITREAEIRLKDEGFMFGTMKDGFGQKMTKISWSEE